MPITVVAQGRAHRGEIGQALEERAMQTLGRTATAERAGRARDLVAGRVACAAIGVVGFAALTALGAFVRIPLTFTPVPITMQTFFVNLAGAVLGPGLGSAAEVLYVGMGVAGLPIFAGAHSGFARLVGPTGGYLIAFMIVPLVIGRLVRLRANPGCWWIVLCMVCGSIITFAVGATQLALFLGAGPVDAFVKGVLPFLPGDSLKIAVGAGVYRAIGPRARQIYG